MRRIPLAVVVAVAAAFSAGAVRADTFAVVRDAPLPTHDVPNAPAALAVPEPLSAPPVVPERRSDAQLLDLWRRAGAAYGVPWQVLAAINKIESDFGRNMGPSSAGALGWMQFMPETWMRWGLDADGDGVASPWNPEDAVYAAARYLAAAGAHDDLPRAVFAYNHAQWYVDDVLELAATFGGDVPTSGAFVGSPAVAAVPTGPEVVFEVDDVEQRLQRARRAVVRAQARLAAAEKKIERLEWKVLGARERAGNPKVSERAFRKLEKRAGRVALDLAAAHVAVERREAGVDEAVARLNAVREEPPATPPVSPATPPVVSADALGSADSGSNLVLAGLGAPQFAGVGAAPLAGTPDAATAASIDPRLSPAIALASQMGLRLTSGHRPGAIVAGTAYPSDHSHFPSKAIDVAGSPSGMHAYALAVARLPGIDTVIYSPVGVWKAGTGWTSIRSATTRRDHFDHVHIDTF